MLLGDTALASPPPWERTPEGVIVHPAHGAARTVRLQVMSDKIVRVTAWPEAGPPTDERGSLAVVAKPERSGFEVATADGKVLVKTPQVTAEVSLDDGAVDFRDASGKVVLAGQGGGAYKPVEVDGQRFLSVTQAFNPGTTEAFWGLGQHQNAQVNLNGEDLELAQHNMDIAVPFVLSSRDYGVLWDQTSISRFGNPTPYALASRDLVLFDADGKPGGLTARYFKGDKLELSRVEPDVNYQYLRDQARLPVKDADKVVWEGEVEPRVGGEQKFQLYSSGYVKLWVDGKLTLDRWRQDWNPWYHNFAVPMGAGERHKVRLEWSPTNGYVALLHDNPLPEAQRHSLTLTSDAARDLDYYFVSGSNLDQVISGYRELTGKAVMLPRWAYGFWQSRQHYASQDEILGAVKEYRRRGVPLDNIVQDWFYWRKDDWGSHRFDPARYPDPKGMIDQLHAMNAHFMISVWPKFYTTTDTFKELDAAGYIYKRNVEVGQKDWVGYVSSFYDPYSEDARKLYWRRIDERLKTLGVDAWWLDASEPDVQSNLDRPEQLARMGPTAMGPAAAYFNSYPLMHTTAVYQGWMQADPNTRPFILTRSGFAGLQRNASAVWSGDVASRWTDLYNQVAAGVGLSMSGLPNWTFDIGGFSLEHRYEHPNPADLQEWRELNLRWFQFGAFAPLFRSHGEAPYREIWNIAPEGSEVYDSLVWYDRLRYRLLPYIYTLAADTYHRDGTIMRGLMMDFPADPKTVDLKDEYLFGHAFLVAPVHAFKARSRPVYLPAGADWYDFYSGARHAGGETIAAAAPLSRMPLFVRSGSIVPTGPAVQSTADDPQGPITLFVYTGADGRFSLYEDDGVSTGYAKGAFARIPIAWDDKTGALTLGAREGSFPGLAAHRKVSVRWIAPGRALDLDAAPDATIDYDGRAVVLHRSPRA
jgi:alpha-D-xyloside xylohydrolase